MSIGLTGAQRTGKTTLAQAFAKEQEILFVQTPTSDIFARLGKDPKIEYPIEERLAIQEAILLAFEKLYAKAGENSTVWISDRTPLDLAGYMLADVQRSTLAGNPEVAMMVNSYVQRCIEATNRWFATVILVQPGIALVEEVGKAPACPAFIEHFNTLQLGLLVDLRLKSKHFAIDRRYTELSDRLEAVANSYNSTMDAALAQRQALAEKGVALH